MLDTIQSLEKGGETGKAKTPMYEFLALKI